MVNYPLVSVIVPVYNMEKYLSRCVDSITEQSYKNLEIILVDDGSTDQSPEICENYAMKDSRIKVVHKKNGGLGPARNTGLENASGEYISFIDSDDWIKENMIEELLNCALTNHVKMVFSSYTVIVSMEGENESEWVRNPPECGLVSSSDAIIAMLKFNGYFTSVWNKLYERSVIFSNDGSYTPFKNVFGEDEEWLTRIMPKVDKVYLEPESYYYYWRHMNSLSSAYLKSNTLSPSVVSVYQNACEWKNLYNTPEYNAVTKAYSYNAGIDYQDKAYQAGEKNLYKEVREEIRRDFMDWVKVYHISKAGMFRRLVKNFSMHINAPSGFVRFIDKVGRKNG